VLRYALPVRHRPPARRCGRRAGADQRWRRDAWRLRQRRWVGSRDRDVGLRLSPSAPREQGAPAHAGGDVRAALQVARGVARVARARPGRAASAERRAVLVRRVHALAADAVRQLHLRRQGHRRRPGCHRRRARVRLLPDRPPVRRRRVDHHPGSRSVTGRAAGRAHRRRARGAAARGDLVRPRPARAERDRLRVEPRDPADRQPRGPRPRRERRGGGGTGQLAAAHLPAVRGAREVLPVERPAPRGHGGRLRARAEGVAAAHRARPARHAGDDRRPPAAVPDVAARSERARTGPGAVDRHPARRGAERDDRRPRALQGRAGPHRPPPRRPPARPDRSALRAGRGRGPL
ncbi:MAG: Flagellar motor switch protein FliM, partial [uncultured Solirubrobacteraceae bacterium]